MDAEASKKEQIRKAFLELQSHSLALVNFTVQWKELEDHFNELEKLTQKGFEELGRKGTDNEKEEESAAEKSTGNPNNEKEKKSAAEKSTGNTNKTSEKNSSAEKSTENPNKTSPVLKDDVKPRPQLKSLCEEMDGEGLKKFLVSCSNVTKIRKEVPAALRCAADPAKLVLQTLDGFYPASNSKKGKKPLYAQRNACDLLLESLPFVLSPDEVSSEAKKDAQKIAAAWKSKLSLDAESPITTVKAHAFLQLLASYGISEEFQDDDLCELVLRIYSHPEAPELCRALRISHKIPYVVGKLSSSGKQIEAIRFVYAFGLVEKISPVTLLKAYMEYAKKASKRLAKKGKNTVGAQNYAASREIDMLKTVINCIGEHKLESQMSSKDLEERVAQLQKNMTNRKRSGDCIEEHKLESQMSSKDLEERVAPLQKNMTNRKRSGEAIKSQTKRARLSGAGAGAGVVAGAGAGAGALLPKPSPPSTFSLSNSSTLLPKPTPTSAFALSNSSDLNRPAPVTSIPSYNLSKFSDLNRPAPVASIPAYNVSNSSDLNRPAPVASIPSYNLSKFSDLNRPAPVASIPSYNLPGQGVYDRGSQGIYQSAYDAGSNPSSLSRSHLYPSDSLQSSLYGVGSFRGSTNHGSYNIGSGVPPATSYQSSYLH